MNQKRKIANDCERATFLIEKKQITTLSIRDFLFLKIHLAGCVVCRIFKKQSNLINQVAISLFRQADDSKLTLDKEFKENLQHQIEDRI